MARKVQPEQPLTPHAIAILIGAICILLACGNGNLKNNEKLAGINRGEPFEPITDLFNDKSSSKKSSPKKNNNTATNKPSAEGGPAFFDIPGDWKLTRADDETRVYQLKHNDREGASVMISYEEIEAEGDERQKRLRSSHENVVGKLPSSFKKQEYREWIVDERPHIHTALKGRPAEDKPEMIISGYSVAIGADTYTVFAAYKEADASPIAADIERVVKSLRPLPAPETTEESEQPEGDTDTPEETSEASEEDLPEI